MYFTIHDDHNTQQEHNPEGDYEPLFAEDEVNLVAQFLQRRQLQKYLGIMEQLLENGDWNNSVEFIHFNTTREKPIVTEDVSVGIFNMKTGNVEPLILSNEEFVAVICLSAREMMRNNPNFESRIRYVCSSIIDKIR